MKRFICLCAFLLLFLSACFPRVDTPTEPPETSSSTEATESTPPTDPPPSTEAPTEPRIGWYEENGEKWYYDESGTMLTGWQQVDGLTYYFREDGTMARGKVVIDGVNTFFTSAGRPFCWSIPGIPCRRATRRIWWRCPPP